MSEIPTLSVKDFKKLRDENKAIKLIDVREEWERAIACLDNDIHVPLSLFADAITEYPKDETYVIYCHHGRRSLVAAITMKEAGFKHVTNLEGGVSAWADQIDQSMPKY